jgi:hypothetical protein
MKPREAFGEASFCDDWFCATLLAMAKKLPKDAKLRRMRGKIIATDESKYWNSAK